MPVTLSTSCLRWTNVRQSRNKAWMASEAVISRGTGGGVKMVAWGGFMRRAIGKGSGERGGYPMEGDNEWATDEDGGD
jgi:hypothetical protein